MTELAFALEEIEVRPYQLTGYLDIDVKNTPILDTGQVGNEIKSFSLPDLVKHPHQYLTNLCNL